jgi:hypothetical protein
MAGKAVDMCLVPFELGIDLLRHADHHSSDFFVMVLVAGKVALDVAVVTADA